MRGQTQTAVVFLLFSQAKQQFAILISTSFINYFVIVVLLA